MTSARVSPKPPEKIDVTIHTMTMRGTKARKIESVTDMSAARTKPTTMMPRIVATTIHPRLDQAPGNPGHLRVTSLYQVRATSGTSQHIRPRQYFLDYSLACCSALYQDVVAHYDISSGRAGGT